MSPDNFVGSGSQGFNRYSYANNNPLNHVDPTGNIAWFVPVIFAAVNVATDLIVNKGNLNFGQIAMSAGQGAITQIILRTKNGFNLH